MNAIFNLDIFYFDIFSLIILILLIIALISGFFNGFLMEVISLVKVVAVFIIAIFLAKPLAEAIFKTEIGTIFSNKIFTWINDSGKITNDVLTSDSEANIQVIMENLTSLGVPDFLCSFLAKMFVMVINIDETTSLTQFIADGITLYSLIIISYLILLIILSIVIGILSHFLKNVKKLPIIGPFDRLLGGILCVGICYLIIDGVLFIANYLIVRDFSISIWLRKTMYLEEENVFTISKFILQHSVVNYLLQLFI